MPTEKALRVARTKEQTSTRRAGKVAALDALLARWGVQPGDVWQVPSLALPGRAHTIRCADAATIEPAGSTLVYDPPWDAGLAPPRGPFLSTLAFADGRHTGRVVETFGTGVAWLFVWDCRARHVIPHRPLQGHKVCLWYGDVRRFRWRDPAGRLSPVPGFPRGHRLADLYAHSLATLHAGGLHPHEKPLEWVRALLGACAEGDVFDPYLGSGTTLLASEASGRICSGTESEPRYVALTLERAQAAGLSPMRA